MHSNLRPRPQIKQRFEFGALGVCGSCWATDRPKAVRGSNELAHATGVSCAEAPVCLPCRSKERGNARGSQLLKNPEIPAEPKRFLDRAGVSCRAAACG